MAKRKSNMQVVKDIMENSAFGPLAQMFVIDALMKLSEAVSVSDPKTFDSVLIHGEAWVGVAKEIKGKLEGQYGVGR